MTVQPSRMKDLQSKDLLQYQCLPEESVLLLENTCCYPSKKECAAEAVDSISDSAGLTNSEGEYTVALSA